MASKADPSRWAGLTPRVFCGNLPYNVSEELLADAFRTVGPVVSTRLVTDRDTGKMKGFGFVEFPDPETASSAVRNMNGYVLEGRELRVDHAEPEKNNRNARNQNRRPQPQGAGVGGGPTPAVPQQQPHAAMPPFSLPPGVQLPPGASATDAISQTLTAIPPDQLLDIMSNMKSFISTSPAEARNLLTSNPSLAYALFQAMILMKVVDPNVLQRMLQQQQQSSMAPSAASQQAPMQPPPVASAVPPQMRGPPVPQMHTPPPPASQAYYGQAAPPSAAYPPPSHRSTPQPTPAPPPPAAPAAGTPAPGAMDINAQRELLERVLSMPQSQIDALPPQDRDTVMQLRHQMGVR